MSMIEIAGFTPQQCKIADLIWNSESYLEVIAIIEKFGVDAIIVKEMLAASVFDNVNETDLAEEHLQKFMINNS